MSDSFSEHIFEENQEIIEYLKNFRLFSHLPDKLLNQLVPLSELSHYPPGADILVEGQINDKVFFLIRGKVSIYAKGELILDLRRKGDIIGEMSVISAKPCSATVTASTPVDIFSIRARHIGEYTEIDNDNWQNTLYRIFSMILTEKLALTTHKAKQYETTNHQLEAANEELKKTQSQLIQSAKLASIGELVTGIAHELNQPLMYVHTNTRLELKRGAENLDPQSAYETLKLVEEGTERMMKLINHLKEFARQTSPEMKPIDLHHILDNSLIIFREDFKLRNIQINTCYATDLPLVSGNSQQLEQVFINMLTNAKDALLKIDDAELTIKTETRQDDHPLQVVVTFTDNGTGIPSSILDKIFDPFFTTKEVSRGTGLGLSISYKNNEKHEGLLRVSSIEGKNTTFEIILPAINDD